MTTAIAAGRREGFALGVALSAFDAAATWLWLSLGLATEANPLLANLIARNGLVSAMALRALLGVVWFAGFAWLSRRTQLATAGQLLTLGLLAIVALYHLGFGATHMAVLLTN